MPVLQDYGVSCKLIVTWMSSKSQMPDRDNKYIFLAFKKTEKHTHIIIHWKKKFNFVSWNWQGESSFNNDELIEGGCMESMTNGLSYREIRQYKTNVYLIRFYFVTRCYNRYVESILNDLSDSPKPDILIMNSCLWDITRCSAQLIDVVVYVVFFILLKDKMMVKLCFRHTSVFG